MPNIFTTGEVATLLSRLGGRSILEVHLCHAVRKARVQAPPVLAGRRLWGRDHVLSAATSLGVPHGPVIAALESGGLCITA